MLAFKSRPPCGAGRQPSVTQSCTRTSRVQNTQKRKKLSAGNKQVLEKKARHLATVLVELARWPCGQCVWVGHARNRAGKTAAAQLKDFELFNFPAHTCVCVLSLLFCFADAQESTTVCSTGTKKNLPTTSCVRGCGPLVWVDGGDEAVPLGVSSGLNVDTAPQFRRRRIFMPSASFYFCATCLEGVQNNQQATLMPVATSIGQEDRDKAEA